jgi:hypothetical protein
MADIQEPNRQPLNDTQTKLGPSNPNTNNSTTTDNSNPFNEGGSGGGSGGSGGGTTVSACADGGIETTIYAYVASSQMLMPGERIGTGPGGNPMTSSQGCAPCAAGQVEVLDPSPYGDQFAGTGVDPSRLPAAYQDQTTCAPPPPTCAPGTYPTWVPETQVLNDGVETGGTNPAHWQCAGPCDLVIQYGAMFGNRLVCAPSPASTTSCGAGQSETFDLNSETWQCQTACTGGTYDQTQLMGVTVCVPC